MPVVATAYVAVLAAGAAVHAALPGATAADLVRASSTDLAHLARDPLLVLAASAVWALQVLPYWIAAAAVSLGALERAIGSRLTLVVVAGVHVVATLLSEGVVGLRILAGALPGSAVHQLDVGPSYVVVAAVCAAVVLRRGRLRWALLLALVPIASSTASGIGRLSVDSLGHLASAALAVAAAWGVRRALRRRLPQVQPVVA